MNELREALIDRMVRIYGLEDPLVISFCNLCETTWTRDDYLVSVVEEHERKPWTEDDE